MAIKYDMYVTPNPTDEEVETTYYAKVIHRDTITTGELAKKIERESSLTDGDIMGVLTSLSYHLADCLLQGDRVHIEGVGFFQLSVTAPTIADPDKMRGDYIRVRTIKFLPEKKLKTALTGVTFERVHTGKHSPEYSDEEMLGLLDEYFDDHQFILRSELEQLCGFTKSTALKMLKMLVEKGVLKKEGTRVCPVYVRQ